jgi:hypothetical protein
VSSVIRYLAVKLGHLEDRGSDAAPPDPSLLEMGNVFEEGIERRFPHFIRIGQLSYDGMFGTLDFFDPIDWCVVEVKWTYMSSSNPPESKKFWKYWAQAKAYCKMLESVDMGTTKVRLIVGHAFGNLDRTVQPRPIINHWYWDFPQSEIDSNWRMVKSHVNAARRAGKNR